MAADAFSFHITVLWLKPEIEVVSRDRAGAYADAVKRALPHATQVADRYHLVQNLRDHLQQFLDRKRTCLPEVEDIPLREGSTHTQGLRDSLADRTSTVESCAEAACEPTEKTSQPQAQPVAEVPKTTREQEPELARLANAERKQKISRDKRYARYEHVLALRQVLGEWRTELPPKPRQGPPRKQRLAPRPRKRRLSSRGASLPLDLTALETDSSATATGCTHEPQRGTPRRLPLEPGVCDHAQRTPGGGLGRLAQAS